MQGYGDWEDLKSELYHEKNDAFLFAMEIDKHIFAACDLVQKEQQKRIADSVSKSKFQKGHYVDISSILSENNLIK